MLKDLGNLVQLPKDFVEFFETNTGELNIDLMKPDGVKYIGLGCEIKNRVCMFGGTLNFEELKQEVEYNLKSTGLLKFANNVINEGGYFIGVEKSNFGKVFYYENYIEWANKDEILLMSNSFKGFIESLKPVGVVFTNLGTEYKFLNEELDSKGNLIGLSVKPIV